MLNRVTLTIPARAEYIDIVRLTLSSTAAKAGCSCEAIEDMKIAVSEACTNAVLHAYSDLPQPETIDVTFDWNRSGFHIAVKDNGSSFVCNDRANVAYHGEPLSEISPGGLGLYMMQALMDDVQIHTMDGTEIVMTKLFAGKEALL